MEHLIITIGFPTHWAGYLGWLFLLTSFCSLGIFAVRMKESKREKQESITSTSTINPRAKAIAAAAGRMAIVVIVFMAGWYSGHIHASGNVKGPWNAFILVKHPDGSYKMLREEDGEKPETNFCADSPEGRTLEVGNRITGFRFRQERDCKSVFGSGLGFQVDTNPDGTRIKYSIGEIANVR